MPRLPHLTSPALNDLLKQLRHESPEAARRQMLRGEELCLNLLRSQQALEAPAEYPSSWVLYRVTGLRLESAGDSEKEMLIGRDELIADLVPLVDRLSSRAELGEVQEGWLTPTELAECWCVSRKTIERWRRLGLLGRRVSLGLGREKITFNPTSIELFEKMHGAKLMRAAGFSRMPEAVRKRLYREARRYVRVLGWSLEKCAQRLSERYRRSVHGVRLVIHRLDARDAKPVFSKAMRLNVREKLVVTTRWRAGEKIPRVESKSSRVTLYRAIWQRRWEQLKELDLDGPTGAMFALPDAGSVVLAPRMVVNGAGVWENKQVNDRVPALPMNLSELWMMAMNQERQLRAGARAVQQQEEQLAGAYWYLLAQARGVLREKTLPKTRLAHQIDQIQTWLVWASRVKAWLVAGQAGLILRSVSAHVRGESSSKSSGMETLADLPEHIKGASANTIRESVRIAIAGASLGADRFDPFKGGRFAAPVGLAIQRALSKRSNSHSLAVVPGRASPRLDLSQVELGDWWLKLNSWQEWLDIPVSWRGSIDRLDDHHARIMELVLGLGSQRPMTLEMAAQSLGISRSGAAKSCREAMAILRLEFAS